MDRLNQWLTLLANLAVLVGVVFVDQLMDEVPESNGIHEARMQWADVDETP